MKKKISLIGAGQIGGTLAHLIGPKELVDQTERSSNYSSMQSLNLVWNQLLRNTIFDQEYKKLGIDAGKDQIEQIISSNPSIVQDTRFLNESGFFDFGIFTDFISQLRNENPSAYQTWKNQEQGIISLAKQNIYFNSKTNEYKIYEYYHPIRVSLENINQKVDDYGLKINLTFQKTFKCKEDKEIYKAWVATGAATR